MRALIVILAILAGGCTTTGDGEPSADLLDTTWVLETVFVGDVAARPEGDPATLMLHGDGSFTASTGCRTFTGSWIADGEQVRATSMTMEDGSCVPDLVGQDAQVVGVLGDGFIPTIDAGMLMISDPGSIGLVYRPAE